MLLVPGDDGEGDEGYGEEDGEGDVVETDGGHDSRELETGEALDRVSGDPGNSHREEGEEGEEEGEGGQGERDGLLGGELERGDYVIFDQIDINPIMFKSYCNCAF